MLDENASFLTKEQLDRHVSLLNRKGFQSLEAEWEVAVLNAFSKVGLVRHEPDLGGAAKLDLLFTSAQDPAVSFVADIAAVSDEGFEAKTPLRDFYVELSKRIGKAGLSGDGFELAVGAHPVRKFNERPRIKIPPRGEFAQEIFNAKFKAFLKQVKEQPQHPARYHAFSDKTDVLLTYTPGKRFFTSTWPTYNLATSKTQNPIYNALKMKAQNQLKKIEYSGPRGIILCDAGSDMFGRRAIGGGYDRSYTAADAIKEFLRKNRSVDFVLMISSVWTDDGLYRPWEGEAARAIRVSVVGNESFDSLPAAVRESLAMLEQHFPVPINIPAGARETLRYEYDSKEFRPLAGGLREVSHNQIKLSANLLFGLLAGSITQEEFFKAMGFKPWSDEPHAWWNSFEYMLSRRMRIAGVQIEEAEHDDDTLIFDFDGPDPALSPFTNPKAD